MNSYRQILYHIVFCTYRRENTISVEIQEELYKFILGVIKNRKGVLYRINGTMNHIHILSDLHPTVSLSDYVKEIKTASNRWLKEKDGCPNFNSWAEGYCALTYNFNNKEKLVNYIKSQKEHHNKISFEEEYRSLLIENGIEIDERYLF